MTWISAARNAIPRISTTAIRFSPAEGSRWTIRTAPSRSPVGTRTPWTSAAPNMPARRNCATPRDRDRPHVGCGPHPHGAASDRRGNMGAQYIIKVPRRTHLERIVSSNGSIHALDVEGPARLKTSNGGVRAENLHGSLDVQTSNGSIEVQNLDGSATCTPPTAACTLRRTRIDRSRYFERRHPRTADQARSRAARSSWRPPTVPSS